MAAQTGAAIFHAGGGRVYYKEIYFDDTAGNLVRWDAGSGAGAATPDSWIAPEAMTLHEVVLAAATGQTQTQINRNDNGTGNILLNALHLASVTFRPRLGVVYPAGSKVTMLQLA